MLHLTFTVDVREKGCGDPEVGERLADQTALQTHRGSHCLAAELCTSHEGQEGIKETESGGTLCGALQEAQHWHGEQDYAVAAQDRRAGAYCEGIDL